MQTTTAVPLVDRRPVGPVAVGVILLGLVTAALAIIGAVAYRAVSPAPMLGTGSATVADGVLPGGVTVFDTHYPGVTNLDAGLLRGVRLAATRASHDGVEFVVNTGWRSPTYQQQLLQDAVAEYGSVAEAARWVASPRTSLHVSGEAIDLGPAAATSWLSDHGTGFGLCQIYRNEPWHFEHRPDAAEQGCPPLYADASQDPRLQHQM